MRKKWTPYGKNTRQVRERIAVCHAPTPAPVGIVEPPRCLSRREGDEWTCPTCRLRWDVGEERPACLAI